MSANCHCSFSCAAPGQTFSCLSRGKTVVLETGRTWPVRGLVPALTKETSPFHYEHLAVVSRGDETSLKCVVLEKFSASEVASLRNDLLQCGQDTFQVADTIKMFVVSRGYGISVEMARDVASKIEQIGYTVECLHNRLEALALVM